MLTLYAAIFVVYAETWAFTMDEGYHLLAAQLISAGKVPYLDFCFPQTPLNAYWNAGWLRLLGESWRVPHLMAALLTIAAVCLIASYVFHHFPIDHWKTVGAIAAALSVGLNDAVFVYGPLQAYGMCLFGMAAAFRLAIRAVQRDGWLATASVGCCAGIAAASSLLSAAATPVLLVWMLWYNRAGSRWRKFVAFALGVAIPFAPVFWLFAQGPRQTWFNLFRYHAFYRTLYWPETTQHDAEILTSWIDDGHALLLGLLALAGLLYVIRQSGWPRTLKAEYYLCAWLSAAIAAEVGRAHPTFSRYFLLTTPFLAILVVPGLYAIARAFSEGRPRWPVALFTMLLALGLGKTVYERHRDKESWADYEPIAAKIDQITPHNAPVLALEPLYFLTRRTPPSGYELSYTHLVELPPAEGALLHILNDDQVKKQVQEGKFATVYLCDEDDVEDYGVKGLYKQTVEMGGCWIFWDWKR